MSGPAATGAPEGNPVRVRALADADAAVWRELFAGYGEFYATAFSTEVLDRVWTLLREPGSGVDALVAEVDGAVAGLAHYRSHPDTFTGGRDWFLDDLYVRPEVRGAGAGTALIAALTTLAGESRPAGSLRWITAADNARAQRVYDRIATRTSWVTYQVDL